MVSISSVGAALPAWRLSRKDIAAAWSEGSQGAGSSKDSDRPLAVCADDEDSLTLAWQAADRALQAGGVAPESVDALVWGTTRPPFAEGPSHALLAAALSLAPTAGGHLHAGSPHAGIEALTTAADMVAAGTATTVLAVASDDPRPGVGTDWERVAGAAAVAVVITAGDDGPAVIGHRATRSDPVLDRYRGPDESSTRDLYDGRLYREQVFVPQVTGIATALAGDQPVATWSLPDPDGRLGAAVARKVGTAAPTLTASLGHTGAAAPLLGAFDPLADVGRLGIVGHGGGRTTGLLVDVRQPVPGSGGLAALIEAGIPASYPSVLRARGQLVAKTEPMPMGVPPGSAGFVRGGREVLGLTGARCADCGYVATPPSVHPRCPACGSGKADEVSLARRGTVQTYVVNQTMPAPFVAPLPIAVLDLEDGARLMLQVADATDVAIGDTVELVLRRYAIERQASIYGYKATVVKGA